MLNKIVGWLVLVPLSLALIAFAPANRQFVIVNFNPFAPVEQLATPGYGVPLFVVLYVVLLVGVLLGALPPVCPGPAPPARAPLAPRSPYAQHRA
ncbi:hypothetical protein N8D56_03690 [Devosia sp. A8/3-2]|nr:hypothetical protein N8D56_03690 [Devosia sp. A8/3-2]